MIPRYLATLIFVGVVLVLGVACGQTTASSAPLRPNAISSTSTKSGSPFPSKAVIGGKGCLTPTPRGQPLNCEWIISHQGGPEPVETVVFKVELPPGVQVLTTSPLPQVSSPRLEWLVGDLPQGMEKRVQIRIEVPWGTREVPIRRRVDYRGGGEGDELLKIGISDFTMTVSEEKVPFVVRQHNDYKILVINQGEIYEVGIVVEVKLPPQLAFVSAAGAEYQLIEKGVKFSIPRVDANQSVELRVRVDPIVPEDVIVEASLARPGFRKGEGEGMVRETTVIVNQ